MILLDTNVLLDIATADPVWLSWSEQAFRTGAAEGMIAINPIIYAELSTAFPPPQPWIAGWIQQFSSGCRYHTRQAGSLGKLF
jgi:hypothetical protein